MSSASPNKSLILALIFLIFSNIFVLSLYLAEKNQVKGLRNEIVSLRAEVEKKLADQYMTLSQEETALANEKKPEQGATAATETTDDQAVEKKIRALAQSIKIKNNGNSGGDSKPARVSNAALAKTPYFRLEGVSDYLNVREEPGIGGVRVGRIPAGDACLKNMGEAQNINGDDWIKIQSGDIVGWVHSGFIAAASGCP